MADTTIDELCKGQDASLLDRVLPWRRRALVRRALQSRLDRMAETVSGIREDHGLDVLIDDIERTRAQGQAAMEKEPHDPGRQAPKQTPDRASQPGRQQ